MSKTSTYAIYRRPYLEVSDKSYKNIITINTMPAGPLSSIVQKVRFEQLSPFKKNTEYACDYGFCSLTNPGRLMNIEELPNLISYLTTNGYTINTKITNVINSNDSLVNTSNNNLIFFINYVCN